MENTNLEILKEKVSHIPATDKAKAKMLQVFGNRSHVEDGTVIIGSGTWIKGAYVPAGYYIIEPNDLMEINAEGELHWRIDGVSEHNSEEYMHGNG